MRPEGDGNDARSGLRGPSHSDELGVTPMDSIEVADYYHGRAAHSMRLLILLFAISNS